MHDWADHARMIQGWVKKTIRDALKGRGINERTIDADVLRGVIDSSVLLPAHAATHESGGADEMDLGAMAGTVLAPHGGTGHTAYTIGDMLYASATNVLSKLAGVATGNALISGGEGTAPSWGKIGLTTHISGVLASANGGTGVNNAGTLTVPVNASITGGGTLALGGFTLTVPATGTAALLATINEFTADQVIKSTVSGTARKVTLRSANAVGGGTGGTLEIEFDDNTAIVGRLLAAIGNAVAADRYFGFIGGTDRDGNRTPIRFWVTNAAGTLRTALHLPAGSDAGKAIVAGVSATPTAPLATFTVYPTAAGDKVAVFRAATSPSVNPFEIQESGGTAKVFVDGGFGLIVGSAALATNATQGFLYIPTCAGTPTGTPTAYTGRSPVVYDTTNNKFYVYNGAWKSVTLA